MRPLAMPGSKHNYCHGNDIHVYILFIITDCTNIPVIRHAVVSEMFGAYRNINTGIKHACVPTDSFVMTGQPLSVCRSGDTWDVLFTCVPKGNNTVYDFHLKIQNIYIGGI